MEKYTYSENEIIISKTQCGLCIYRDDNNDNSCEKYSQKSEEILKGSSICPYLKTTSLLDF